MSTLLITGSPVCSFEFIGLPSVNTHYNKHRFAKSIATAEWRTEAKDKAGIWMWGEPELKRPIINRALVVINVFPPVEEISDIHNVWVKAILDGFSDAGLWVDDEWAFVPLVLFAWAGIGEHKPGNNRVRKTRIDIYELRGYLINDKSQQLPKGRVWLNQK